MPLVWAHGEDGFHRVPWIWTHGELFFKLAGGSRPLSPAFAVDVGTRRTGPLPCTADLAQGERPCLGLSRPPAHVPFHSHFSLSISNRLCPPPRAYAAATSHPPPPPRAGTPPPLPPSSAPNAAAAAHPPPPPPRAATTSSAGAHHLADNVMDYLRSISAQFAPAGTNLPPLPLAHGSLHTPLVSYYFITFLIQFE